MKRAQRAGALLGLAAILGFAAGCPLTVTDDYAIEDVDPGAPAISSGASSGGPSDADNDECGEGFWCAPAPSEGALVRIELAGLIHCPPGWGSPSSFTDGIDPGCACACSSASNGACKPGTITVYESSSCGPGENKEDLSPKSNGACVDVYTGASGVEVDAPSATPGSCTASDPSPPPLALRACALIAPVEKSCSGGDKVCVPAIGPPPARLCNLVPPGGTCAQGFTPEKTIYQVSEDTRVCACSCGSASPGACVGASVELHSGDECAESLNASLPAGAPCGDAAAFDSLGSVKVDTGTWVGGQCEAVEKVSGDIKLNTLAAYTLCCAAE
jgi:hypothetical protein